MTPEQIIKMAKQANIDWDDAYVCTEYRVGLSQLQAFAKLIRNAALEDAAKVCEVNHHTALPSPDSFECTVGIRSLKS